MDAIMGFFQGAIDWLVALINSILFFLPDSPFQFTGNSEIAKYMGYLNYFIPVGSFVIVTAAWLSAVAVFYVFSAILRLIKAIE